MLCLAQVLSMRSARQAQRRAASVCEEPLLEGGLCSTPLQKYMGTGNQ